MIDWRAFCDEHRIDYRETGPSTKKENIYIECPWCRDGKQYMGLDLARGWWGCWKNQVEHSGKSPVKLIAALLRCTYSQARDFAGIRVDADLDDLAAKLAEINRKFSGKTKKEKKTKLETIKLPGFPILDDSRSIPFLRYLDKRGFLQPVRVAKRYGLHGDRISQRIIFPLFSTSVERPRIVGWTGRAIVEAVRRLDTQPPAAASSAVWGAEHAPGGRRLVLCEGPFDALAVSVAARGRVHAVAMLGISPGRDRVATLAAIARRYDRVGLLLDRGTEREALALQAHFPFDLEIVPPVPGYKDPADTPHVKLRKWLRRYFSQKSA